MDQFVELYKLKYFHFEDVILDIEDSYKLISSRGLGYEEVDSILQDIMINIEFFKSNFKNDMPLSNLLNFAVTAIYADETKFINSSRERITLGYKKLIQKNIDKYKLINNTLFKNIDRPLDMWVVGYLDALERGNDINTNQIEYLMEKLKTLNVKIEVEIEREDDFIV